MAKVNQVFDMRFAHEGVNVLDPPGNRGPPPCAPGRGGSFYRANEGHHNPYYNDPVRRAARGRFVDAGINEYKLGVPLRTPRQIPGYYDMTTGSVQEDIEDGLGNNYTRLAACNQLSSGMKNWNGRFNVYPEDDGEPRTAPQNIRWQYKPGTFIRPADSVTDPTLFYPRYRQPNVYELQQDMADEEMVSMGPISVKKNWLTWILVFILVFFVLDKMLLSTMMLRNMLS